VNKIETLEDIKWVDTHCHLQLMGDEINEQDISNLEYFIIPGVDIQSSLKAKEFSNAYSEKSYWSAGLHPHEADLLDNVKNDLQALMMEADLIGETGLDYYRNLSSKENQIKSFEYHIDVSKELNKPLIIHCRDSFSDVYETLIKKDTTNPIILHSWTGGNKWTKKFIDLDVYFSISGIVTYDTAHDLQAAVNKIPKDKILLETDVPYLAPEPFKGKRNNPTYIKHTGVKLAELLGLTPNELSKITISNTNKVMNRES
jgi:TatD DNase family protein